MSLRPGMTLDHRYELRGRLGEGGQGSVWRAFDRNTGAERALKVLHLPGQDREAAERARREAHLVKDARHPAVVTCRSLFEIPSEDVLVLVFDLVQGSSLADVLEDPRLDRARRLAALRHIAGALAFLHARGIVHRDLKPDNVLVTSVFWEDPADPEGLKLIDFGIAAPRRGPDGSTLSGRFGTPPYMAPELFSAAGLDAQRSPARDVFAFGVIGWELLERGHPSGLSPRASAGDYQAEYEHRRRGRDPWPPRAQGGRWGSVLTECLALDPAGRPQDGGAILSLLAGAPETPAPPEVAAQRPSAPGGGQRPSAPGGGQRPSAPGGGQRPSAPGGGQRPSAPGEGGPPRQITAPHSAPRDVEPEPAAGEPWGASPPSGPAAPAPAIPAARTEIAPASSLPRRSAVDRTARMPPDIGFVASPERASSPGDGATPGKSLSSEEGPASGSPGSSPIEGKGYTESASGGTWPIVVAALLLVGALAAGTGWLLLGGKGREAGSLPEAASASSAVPTAPSASATAPPVVSAPTASADSAAPTASADSAAAPSEVCCPDSKDRCPSGVVCRRSGCKPGSMPELTFVPRVVLVEDWPDPYSEKRNLANVPADRSSIVCVEVGDKDEACARMTDIAKPGGSVLSLTAAENTPAPLRLSAAQIRDKGLLLRIRKARGAPLEARLLPTRSLLTSALCKTLTLKDAKESLFLTFYLDDPKAAEKQP